MCFNSLEAAFNSACCLDLPSPTCFLEFTIDTEILNVGLCLGPDELKT